MRVRACRLCVIAWRRNRLFPSHRDPTTMSASPAKMGAEVVRLPRVVLSIAVDLNGDVESSPVDRSSAWTAPPMPRLTGNDRTGLPPAPPAPPSHRMTRR